jgi:hypothetical protein
MKIKAIAVDVDGTITDMQGKISIEAISALREVERSGIKVILATGNVLLIAKNLSKLIGTCGAVIAENGGVVYFDDKEIVLASRKKADEAFDYLSKFLTLKKVSSDAIRMTEVAIEEVEDVNKIRALLQVQDWDLKVENTGFAIHITRPWIDKFEGLKIIARAYDIALGDIIAIGDSNNDAEMLKGCGIGIAVANATPDAKAAANYIMKRRFGDGVVEALKRLDLVK